MSTNINEASKLVVESAQLLVKKLIATRRHDNPPFLAEEYAPLVGIHSIEKMNLGKAGGILLRYYNRPVIKININDPPVRQNFSCAHEIGHMLLSELKLESYINSIEHRTYNPQAERKTRSKAVEKLCDEAATELLMPLEIFQSHLKEKGMSINSIEHLAEMYKVSIQSAAIRASEIYQDSSMILKWAPRKSYPDTIQLSWPKNKILDKVLFSPVKKAISPPSKFHEAFECNNLVKGEISFKVGKQTKRFAAEIKGYGYGDKRYILSLVFLNG
jgi:Zn-dependent peptidase ImmA (M78 family)